MNVFSYGSLMFPEVMTALTGCQFLFEDTTLAGFERRSLKEAIYPGLRENHESSVDGRLWFDLGAESMSILERFEDALYDRRTVQVMSPSRGLVKARAYVVPARLEYTLADNNWDKEMFEKNHLDQYVRMCCCFRSDFMSCDTVK